MLTQQQPRLFVYAADLMNIYTHFTNPHSCYKKYRVLKKLIGKKEHQYITVKELAEWEGIPENELRQRIE